MSSAPSSNQIFEIFGVYFANCYWNNLYNKALDIWHTENRETLDESYQAIISRYNTAFCKKIDATERYNKHYVDIVRDIHKNYKEYLGISCSYDQFIDSVVQHFIPQQLYRELPSRDSRKDGIFRDILSKTLTKFTLFVSQEGVNDVLSNEIRRSKKVPEYIQSWKRKFVDILVQEKNQFCGLILAKTNGVDIRNQSDLSAANQQIYDKLNEKIRELIVEKNKMITERNQYAKLASTYKELLLQREGTIQQLIAKKKIVHEAPPIAAPVLEQEPINQEFDNDIILDIGTGNELIPDD